jgi:SAM-dependent methyltransferase
MGDFATLAFRTVSRRQTFHFDRDIEFDAGFANAEKYLDRLGNRLPYRDADVLDVGCGLGSTCVYLAEHGARHVLGVDINDVAVSFGAQKVRGRQLDDTVELQHISDIDEVSGTFDLILSQDSFEHIDPPEPMIAELVARLRPNGTLAIGFSTLWNSPFGGHIKHMTWLPWAHRLFPERVIMGEQDRFYPPELRGRMGQSFKEYGLNQMSFSSFVSMMDATALHREYFAVNVHERSWKTRLCRGLRLLPGGRELFTFNVYGLWRKPMAPADGDERTSSATLHGTSARDVARGAAD